ncbi:MAG: GTPase ObgE [Vampirovibrionales bacterium]|nr:GTPase ObgE [Vampirovibrionales bacterium]
MQFVDKVTIQILSGAGGDGMVAWRREKYEPFGGPAGGDGGKGGDVWLEASESLNTLLEFRYESLFHAEDGHKGRPKNMHGRGGEDLILKVPCGTIVRDHESGFAVADLTEPGQRALVAAGGRGGRGNSRFTSSRRQAPQFCEPGEPGIPRTLDLELKLIAEVGLIGLPNAGKSTLISVISAARPKIADYPFTTLTPNLGVVRKPNGDGVLVADIPGLIEGASEGAGLGHEFLRHVERTRVLLHLVDMSADMLDDAADSDAPLQNYRLIRTELARYSERLASKPQLVALTKADVVSPEQADALAARFAQELGGAPLFVISAATRQGLEPLMEALFEALAAAPDETAVVELMVDVKATNHDDSAFEVHRKGKAFHVSGGKVERLMGVMDPRNRAAVMRTMNILRAMGVMRALEREGIRAGQAVHIAGHTFEYLPDDDGIAQGAATPNEPEPESGEP